MKYSLTKHIGFSAPGPLRDGLCPKEDLRRWHRSTRQFVPFWRTGIINRPWCSCCFLFHKYVRLLFGYARMSQMIPYRAIISSDAVCHSCFPLQSIPSHLKLTFFFALSTENYSLNRELTQALAPFHFSFNYSQQASNINLIKSWNCSLLKVRLLGGSRSRYAMLLVSQ